MKHQVMQHKAKENSCDQSPLISFMFGCWCVCTSFFCHQSCTDYEHVPIPRGKDVRSCLAEPGLMRRNKIRQPYALRLLTFPFCVCALRKILQSMHKCVYLLGGEDESQPVE